jgi:arylformamidase
MISKGKNMYDISMPLTRHIPVWPGSEAFQMIWTKNFEQHGINESALSFNTHTGTHIDMPYHFLKNGKRMRDIPLDRFMGKAFIAEYKGDGDISQTFLERIPIPRDCSILLFKTKNSSYDIGQGVFRKDYIALSPEGVEWIRAKGIRLVGIDSLSIQSFDDKSNETHKILLENDILILEGLNLKDIEEGIYTLIVLPLNIPEAEGSPARAILVEES